MIKRSDHWLLTFPPLLAACKSPPFCATFLPYCHHHRSFHLAPFPSPCLPFQILWTFHFGIEPTLLFITTNYTAVKGLGRDVGKGERSTRSDAGLTLTIPMLRVKFHIKSKSRELCNSPWQWVLPYLIAIHWITYKSQSPAPKTLERMLDCCDGIYTDWYYAANTS